jgi:hypothetical protein
MKLYRTHKGFEDFCALIARGPETILGRMEW